LDPAADILIKSVNTSFTKVMSTQNLSSEQHLRENTNAKPSPPLLNWVQPLVLLAAPGIWLLLLLVVPTVLILELSFVPGIRPGDVVNPSGLDNYIRIFDPLYLRVLKRSLFFALNTTLICLALGLPVAYWIAQIAPQRWRNLLLISFVLPLWTSSLLRSYAWITILRPTGLLNSLLSSVGLPTLDILHRSPSVLIGMSYSLLPYMVLILYASLEKLDKRLLEAAADLGANPVQAFCQVTVPQTITGIFAGSFLVFITALGDFVNPELLGGASSMTTARLVYNQFLGATQNWGFGSALSMMLILVVSIAIALLIRLGNVSPKR
jgi:spermidine/putrescine transport system permease protein